MASSRAGRPARGARWLAGLAVVAALVFAVQGGEYSSVDLFRQRARADSLQHDVDSLQRDIDSLRSMQVSLRSDPVVQERIAREMYGMVRGDKEIVYRFIDDSARAKP
ncbi:MAG: septum formation initiator family protein [Gemmatimonadetes bacterium]|nr:septum formation initiator family protein [Gemmatimonadota bacterium]